MVLDVVYRRSAENLSRLVAALAPLSPCLRGAPPNLPFVFDVPTAERGLNFTLDSDKGAIDLLGEVVGGDTFDALLPHTETIDLFGFPCRVVTLDTLIALKRAAGRPKDLEVIAELELLASQRRPSQGPGGLRDRGLRDD